MKKKIYKWHGERVKVEFGTCIVTEKPELPLWWSNFECHLYGMADASGKRYASIPAVRVTTKDDEQFILSNHSGISVHKLLKGGWPNFQHFSMSGIFHPNKNFEITEFAPLIFIAHEEKRAAWQKVTYPAEYAKLQLLLEHAPKFQ